MFYRVFGPSESEIQPADLLAHLHQNGLAVKGHFRGDDQGWFEVELVLDERSQTVQRYLANEDGVRAELNTWAGWVEQQESFAGREQLMQQIVGTQQIIVMQVAEEEQPDSPLHRMCTMLSQYLATQTGGFYQADNQGFFAADGSIMLAE